MFDTLPPFVAGVLFIEERSIALLAKQTGQVKRILQDPIVLVSLTLMVIFVGLAVVYPIWAMVEEAFSEEGKPLFERYLTGETYQIIIQNTIKMGLIVGALGTVLGFIMAFVQVKVDVPLKGLMHIVALIPIISPPFAIAMSTIILLGRNGIISKDVFGVRYDIYGLDGLTLVLVLSLFPISYLNFKGMLLALDPALDEAATNLGAGRWHIFRTVTIPMLMPGIAGSFLLLFVEAIADLGNPIVMGGNYEVLSTRIWVSIIGLYNTTGAAVLSIILLLPSLTVFVVQRYWLSRISVVSVTGKPSGTPQMITHPLVRWGLFLFALTVTVVIAVLYGTIIVGAFTRILGVNNELTLDHFDYVINGYGSEAMTDTTRLSAISTPLAGIIGMVIAFLVVRKAFFASGALDFATMMGIAVPGTVLGIGYLLAFNTPNEITLPIFGDSVTIVPKLTGGRAIGAGSLAIVLVYITRSAPAVLRSGVAALTQIDPAIEEAAVSLGGNSFHTFRTITLPLIRPAFLAGLIYSFSRSMTTISAIIFLTTPRTRIMTAQILNEVEGGRFGNAFAYCTILIGIVLAAIAILYAVVGSRTGAEQTIERGR
jgi:iron(III) transport system permease protein